MKNLELNPTGHEIAISADIESEEYAQVCIKLSADGGDSSGALTKSECEKIAKWFSTLAGKLK